MMKIKLDIQTKTVEKGDVIKMMSGRGETFHYLVVEDKNARNTKEYKLVALGENNILAGFSSRDTMVLFDELKRMFKPVKCDIIKSSEIVLTRT